MSTDWNIRCRDCNVVHTFNDANRQEDLMVKIIEHADAIANLTPFLKSTARQDVELKTYWGTIDAEWFAQHRGHRLVPHNEYGRDLDQCWKSVTCCSCERSSRPCKLKEDHEGDCDPDAPDEPPPPSRDPKYRCTRTVCQLALDDATVAFHKDTKEPYCFSCARKINDACRDVGHDLVPLPKR